MSRKIVEPAIQNLIDLNGWMIKWKPKNLARALDLPVGMLYSARDAEWFHKNVSWISYLYWYYTIDLKSRFVEHKDIILAHPALKIDTDMVKTILYSDVIHKYKKFNTYSLIAEYWSYQQL